jgi:SulP family sulfate permease
LPEGEELDSAKLTGELSPESKPAFFRPAIFNALRSYNFAVLRGDLIAGVTVGLVALPLAMAFAISSGMSPESGLYTAVIAGFLISALGGSRTQIGGPTGAFVVIVYGIVQKYDITGLFMCTLMAGVLLLILGATGLGTAVRFIPRPVIVGFTNGIAVLIASTQIKDFLGLKIAKVPGEFLARMEAIGTSLHTFSSVEVSLGICALIVIVACMRYLKRVPGYIIALLFGTAAVVILKLPVETIGTRFGGIPSGLPKLVVPEFHINLMIPLISPAITVAMLGAIESLMSAVVADRMSREKHDPNQELMAQGIANIVSPLFGGLPVTGAIARTATNIRSGGKTPISGIVHALTLLAVLLVAAPLAKFIPLSVLAAILLVVSYNMGEWHEIPELLKLGKSDIWIWLLTFALTVFADLTVAVEFGMILAALVFIRNVTATTTVTEITAADIEDGRPHVLQGKEIPPYVSMFRIHGPFLFGATEKVSSIVQRLPELSPVVILRLRNMTVIDATGLNALQTLSVQVRASGRAFIICGIRSQPARLLQRAGFEQHVGKENICAHVAEALERAKTVYPEVAGVKPQTAWKRRKSDSTESMTARV